MVVKHEPAVRYAGGWKYSECRNTTLNTGTGVQKVVTVSPPLARAGGGAWCSWCRRFYLADATHVSL